MRYLDFLSHAMKTCPKCGNATLIKYGTKNWKQRYQCRSCRSIVTRKPRQTYNSKQMYDLYCFQNRTYKQLATQFWLSIKTVQNRLDSVLLKKDTTKVHRIHRDGYNLCRTTMMSDAVQATDVKKTVTYTSPIPSRSYWNKRSIQTLNQRTD